MKGRSFIRRWLWPIVGTAAVALGIAAIVRPARTPTYLDNLRPTQSGWGWEVFESPDTNGALETMLAKDWARQDLWTDGGNITYVDVCSNYMSNRFLYIEWG